MQGVNLFDYKNEDWEIPFLSTYPGFALAKRCTAPGTGDSGTNPRIEEGTCRLEHRINVIIYDCQSNPNGN